MQMGRYRIDLANHTVHSADDPDETVHLTRTEWQLLDVLLRDPAN